MMELHLCLRRFQRACTSQDHCQVKASRLNPDRETEELGFSLGLLSPAVSGDVLRPLLLVCVKWRDGCLSLFTPLRQQSIILRGPMALLLRIPKEWNCRKPGIHKQEVSECVRCNVYLCILYTYVYSDINIFFKINFSICSIKHVCFLLFHLLMLLGAWSLQDWWIPHISLCPTSPVHILPSATIRSECAPLHMASQIITSQVSGLFSKG